MDYIYGKLNQKAQLTEYRGLSTDSSTVVVDNTNKTIRVDFTGSIMGSLGGGKINTISVNGNKLNKSWSNMNFSNLYSGLFNDEIRILPKKWSKQLEKLKKEYCFLIDKITHN